MDDVKKEEALIKKAKAGLLIEKKVVEKPENSENLRTFYVFLEDDYFEVGVDDVGGSPVIAYAQEMPMGAPMPAPAAKPAAPAAAPAAPPKAEAKAEKAAPAATPADGTPLTAPMPGMIVAYKKNVGDEVTEGETVLILEAMKMENALAAPCSGTIKALNFDRGDSVAKGDVLCVIG